MNTHTWVVDLVQQFHRPSRDNTSNMSQGPRRNGSEGTEWKFLWEKFEGGKWLKRRDAFCQELTEEDCWRTGTEMGWWKPPLLDEVPAVTKVSMITWQREKGVCLWTGLSHFQSSVCVLTIIVALNFGSMYVLLCTQMKEGKPENVHITPPSSPPPQPLWLTHQQWS